jgi:hypothetical protein
MQLQKLTIEDCQLPFTGDPIAQTLLSLRDFRCTGGKNSHGFSSQVLGFLSDSLDMRTHIRSYSVEIEQIDAATVCDFIQVPACIFQVEVSTLINLFILLSQLLPQVAARRVNIVRIFFLPRKGTSKTKCSNIYSAGSCPTRCRCSAS